MSTAEILVGFVVSTVGFSLFLYGKKQQRAPQLIVGVLMMVSPFVVHDPIWESVTAIVLVIGTRIAIRSGI